jgi:TonB-dependent receptor
MESDELLNTLNAAEFAKFAASDVADALKFVPGVNVVNGQFAIIRGLEDRYSSTLYNSAVVPSPDPNRQSVQLDLFPSDVVTNLVVSKTFAPDLPSNSSGGAINILTNEYPESFEFKLSGGSGFNSNARDDFLKFNGGSPMGTPTDGWNTAKNDYGFSLGGRTEFAEREVRYKFVGGSEVKYQTQKGSVSAREPAKAQTTFFPPPGQVTRSGDLAFGRLSLSEGSFDLNESERSDQQTGYTGLGFDLDPDGHHKIDATVFYTQKKQTAIQLYENGHIEGLDYGALAQATANGEEILPNSGYFEGVATNTAWIARSVRATPNDPISRGPLWSDNFAQSESFDVDRKLVVYQLNGDHTVDSIPGLHYSWAANTARTSQEETSLGARFFYEPNDATQIPDTFPVTVAALGPGRFYANDGLLSSGNSIRESQNFGRLDADYEMAVSTALTLRLDSGVWYERATRNVGSNYLESPLVGNSSQYAIAGDTALELGSTIFPTLNHTATGQLAGVRNSTTDGMRKLKAWNFGGKATAWDDLDLLAGARYESISIDSNNNPFTGEPALDGSPATFPTKYLFFDRLDNPARGEVNAAPPPGTTFNDEILGISVTPDPTTGFVDLPTAEEINGFINGSISETRLLPSLGFTYRALDGLNLRGAYSQTVARPSFREMGFYVSVEPGSDDLVVGNPQLQLSDVTSYDLRTEYVWGEVGDLAAISAFYKNIDKPIESIVVRDPQNFEGSSSALYRTFFNNPSRASLWGIELEARKNLGILGFDFAQYFSIGGNFTYIDATVDRTDAELARSKAFFPTVAGQQATFMSYQKSRRLFGQPEWIANVDVTFDDPDWGTKLTLAFFGISDILDAAGSAAIAPDGSVSSFTLDRYLDSYTQLNLIASQTWPIGIAGGDVTLKGNVKNLTNSTRRMIYDQDQTSSRIAQRTWKNGLDYSLSLTYSISF